MEEIRVNRLPAITWRYLHVNDSPDKFEFPGNSASAVFLINGMCRKAARFLPILRGIGGNIGGGGKRTGIYCHHS